MADPDYTAEQWRAIPGWEDCYEASDFGRIRSLPRRVKSRWGNIRTIPGRVRIPIVDAQGYHSLILTKAGRRPVKQTVHRIVCLAFYGVPAGGMQAAHWDGVKSNNRADNLRWATPKENKFDDVRHGVRGTGGNARLSAEQVLLIRSTKGGDATTGLRALARRFGVSKATISNARRKLTYSSLDSSSEQARQ